MSSAVFSTSAAQGRPFIFDGEIAPEVCPFSIGNNRRAAPITKAFSAIHSEQLTIKNQQSKIPSAGVIPASRLAVHPAPEMVSSGIAAIDTLTGGLPRGCLTEICGPLSSGRTSVLFSALAAATWRGEFCALMDASDALDPQSATAAGIELDRLLWVRCGENSDHAAHRHIEHGPAEQSLEQLLRVADLLLESGGFGLIALDLGDLTPQTARRIPLTTWFRFRRAVEHTPTVLLAIERQSIAGSCSSLLLRLAAQGHRIKQPMDSQFPLPTHAQLLTELEITAEIVRSRMDRRPARSAEITFTSKTAWDKPVASTQLPEKSSGTDN